MFRFEESSTTRFGANNHDIVGNTGYHEADWWIRGLSYVRLCHSFGLMYENSLMSFHNIDNLRPYI